MSRISAMKRALVATGIAALLLLTGCTSTNTTETAVTPNAAGDGSSGGVTIEVQPLTAESPTPSADDSSDQDEAAFVAEVRSTLRPANVIPNATDEQLVQAGRKACEMKQSGMPAEDISVIEGEERGISGYYLDSLKIYDAAKTLLC